MASQKRHRKEEVGSRSLPKPFQDQDFQKLRKKCLTMNEKFTDEEFQADRRSVGLLSSTRMAGVVWKRPSDLVDNPCFIVDDQSRFDYSQGDLGNCWFLAAIGAMTSQKSIMDQVIPADQSFQNDYAGIFHFRFCYSGNWVDVVVDDQLPTLNGELVFVHCKTKNEFWPALLEKAYAKLYGSYAALNGGYVSDGLRDFTGGVYKTYRLRNAPSNMWDLMDRAVKHRSLLACGTPRGKTSANTVLPNGIVEGHAYAITGVTKLHTRLKLVKLVRVLNPWGKGEWNGDWSDKSPRWKDVSPDDSKTWLEDKNNGEFWMSMDDFCKSFDELDICCTTPDVLI